jgi:hypothetical protein
MYMSIEDKRYELEQVLEASLHAVADSTITRLYDMMLTANNPDTPTFLVDTINTWAAWDMEAIQDAQDIIARLDARIRELEAVQFGGYDDYLEAGD